MRAMTCVTAALVLTFAAACDDRDRDETASRIDTAGEEVGAAVREGAEDVGDAVDDATDDLDDYSYERRDEFRRDVGGICRAASVPKQQHFMPLTERPHDQLCHFDDAVRVLAHELLLDGGALGEGLYDKVFHRVQF